MTERGRGHNSGCVYGRAIQLGGGLSARQEYHLLGGCGKDVGVLHYQAFEPGVTRDDVAMFLTILSTILDDESATPSWTTPSPIVTCRLLHTDNPFSSSHPTQNSSILSEIAFPC